MWGIRKLLSFVVSHTPFTFVFIVRTALSNLRMEFEFELNSALEGKRREDAMEHWVDQFEKWKASGDGGHQEIILNKDGLLSFLAQIQKVHR